MAAEMNIISGIINHIKQSVFWRQQEKRLTGIVLKNLNCLCTYEMRTIVFWKKNVWRDNTFAQPKLLSTWNRITELQTANVAMIYYRWFTKTIEKEIYHSFKTRVALSTLAKDVVSQTQYAPIVYSVVSRRPQPKYPVQE